MTSFLRGAAGVAVVCLLTAPWAVQSAQSQAQGAHTPPPRATAQPVKPAAKAVAPKPTFATPAPAKPVASKPGVAMPVAPKPAPPKPVITPVIRPAPIAPPATSTPFAQPTPRPAPTVVATASGPGPVIGCARPGQPAVPAQAAGVSLTQMDATRNAAVAYFAAADVYRTCLDRFIEVERDKMFKNNTAETPELKRAAYEHSGFSEEKGRIFEAVTLFCYNWQSANQREYPSGCALPWNPGG